MPRGFRNVKVTADFTEYAAEEGGVPSDIQTIATRVVGAMIMLPEIVVGVQSETIEGHQVVLQRNVRGAEASIFLEDPIVKALMDGRRIPLIDNFPTNDLSEEAEDTLGIY